MGREVRWHRTPWRSCSSCPCSRRRAEPCSTRCRAWGGRAVGVRSPGGSCILQATGEAAEASSISLYEDALSSANIRESSCYITRKPVRFLKSRVADRRHELTHRWRALLVDRTILCCCTQMSEDCSAHSPTGVVF